ncbi:hypothetical protein ACFU44_22895 [Nocardia rhizosphaerihabitans]|uniref:hypothetical protein n=1 Tax=Nocardia rhizosphaerihabitans TaxID=1691570 RepID=UPI00366B2102
MHKISTIQDIITANPHHYQVTVVLVTGDRTGELVPLARLALADFSRFLCHAFPEP